MGRLKCSTSLWSADLSNLASEIERVEPFSERFHLDVADGQIVDTLLFFPDLVAAIRRHTERPFEIHLIASNPDKWVKPFVEAGGDIFIVYPGERTRETMELIRSLDKKVGISLGLTHDLSFLNDLWEVVDVVTIVGTDVGIKGADMDKSVPGRIRQCRHIVDERGLSVDLEADGGIRRHTVPLIAAAGADYIVPGSLMFSEDPQAVRTWLDTL